MRRQMGLLPTKKKVASTSRGGTSSLISGLVCTPTTHKEKKAARISDLRAQNPTEGPNSNQTPKRTGVLVCRLAGGVRVKVHINTVKELRRGCTLALEPSY